METTYMDIVDAMPVSNKVSIPTGKEQAYRNVASTLKRLKQKHFVVRKIGTEFVIVRLM